MSLPVPDTIRIATRASALAMWQANYIADRLRELGIPAVELVEVSTIGDRDQSEPLSSLSTSIEGGSTGVFTREVQRAVLDGRADIAVHSLKDLPTTLVDGLQLAGIPERAPRFDRLVFPQSSGQPLTVADLPVGARIGTGALRRQAQLKHLRPDLELAEIRGNVDTRLRKLDVGEYDAIILAAAGMTRLGFDRWPSVELCPPVMWPAVGQAALGIECRADDEATAAALEGLTDHATRQEVTAERALLAALRAGCHAPVGTLTRASDTHVVLEAVVLSPDGTERVIAAASGRDPAQLGQHVAAALIARGADEYLA